MINTYILISFFIVSILGVLFHFFHKWFKRGFFLHVFSAINESVWEHTKLAFYPMLLTVVIHSFIPEFYFSGYWGDALVICLASIILIPLLYYPIRWIIGKEVPAVSIGLYFVCIGITFYIEYVLIENKTMLLSDSVGIAGIILLMLIYALFTYFPPKHGIFKDPIYKKFGEFKQKFDKHK